MQQIRGRGFTPSVEEEESAKPSGEVIRQTPNAGSQLPAGSTVSIVVSKGEAKATVPNVIGKLRADAVEALRAEGLKPTVNEAETEVPSQVGRVTDQFPPPGSEVKPGSAVTVVVGKQASGPRRTGSRRRRMRVAVLSGGRSSEHDVSLRSGEAVARGLEEAGHEALRVKISREGSWSCDGGAVELAPGAGLLDADVAFPALHGPFGEDGSVQGLLEWLDLPYVGSDVLSSAVCMDKLTLKRLFAQAGVPQVDFVAAGEPGWRERCEADGPAALGQAVAARLQRRHQQGRAARATSTRPSSSPVATTRG